MAQCDFCFRDKHPLQPADPHISAQVCKGCAYEIAKVIGFIRHSGGTITSQRELGIDDTPPPPTSSKSRREKS